MHRIPPLTECDRVELSLSLFSSTLINIHLTEFFIARNLEILVIFRFTWFNRNPLLLRNLLIIRIKIIINSVISKIVGLIILITSV